MSTPCHGVRRIIIALHPSRHPFKAGCSRLLFVIFGAAEWINGVRGKVDVLFAGLAWCGWWCCSWFRDSRPECSGLLRSAKDRPVIPLEHELVHLPRGHVLRCLFTALWWMRTHRFPALGSPLINSLLWPGFAAWLQCGAGCDGVRGHRRPSRPWARSGCPPSTRALLLSLAYVDHWCTTRFRPVNGPRPLVSCG